MSLVRDDAEYRGGGRAHSSQPIGTGGIPIHDQTSDDDALDAKFVGSANGVLKRVEGKPHVPADRLDHGNPAAKDILHGNRFRQRHFLAHLRIPQPTAQLPVGSADAQILASARRGARYLREYTYASLRFALCQFRDHAGAMA